jgi:GH24 family phage-related lysozyme (muramidase)
MTRDHLNASLKLWQEREARFRRNWKSKRKGDPRRVYWFRLLKHAITMADRRQDQLHQLGTVGVSAAGVELVKRFEGFRSKPYQDAVGVWTIGYGETRGVTSRTRPVTEAEAAAQLRRRLDRDYFPTVKALPTFSVLTQHQVDALTSFIYNVGFVLPGLKTRREAERALFLKP